MWMSVLPVRTVATVVPLPACPSALTALAAMSVAVLLGMHWTLMGLHVLVSPPPFIV